MTLRSPEEVSHTFRNAALNRVRQAGRTVRRLEKQLTKAIVARDELLRELHGPRSSGGLSYAELAEAAGLSRNRVIQIAQPPRGEADGNGG